MSKIINLFEKLDKNNFGVSKYLEILFQLKIFDDEFSSELDETEKLMIDAKLTFSNMI